MGDFILIALLKMTCFDARDCVFALLFKVRFWRFACISTHESATRIFRTLTHPCLAQDFSRGAETVQRLYSNVIVTGGGASIKVSMNACQT